MKRILGIGIAVLLAGAAQAALLAGDITIIGYRSDSNPPNTNDQFTFVTWQDIAAGTTLYFTDSGFFNDGTLRDSENVDSWTAPAGGTTAGTVVRFQSESELTGLAVGGDQIFIGLTVFSTNGDTTKPGSAYTASDLIYGIDFANTAGWDADATSANTSWLPTVLSGTYKNASFGTDNGQYTGVRTGKTIEEFKALIHNSANWTLTDDTAAFPNNLDETSFSIIPEPASFGLLALGALGVRLIRRRRG
jgi:hypothetical protein